MKRNQFCILLDNSPSASAPEVAVQKAQEFFNVQISLELAGISAAGTFCDDNDDVRPSSSAAADVIPNRDGAAEPDEVSARKSQWFLAEGKIEASLNAAKVRYKLDKA